MCVNYINKANQLNVIAWEKSAGFYTTKMHGDPWLSSSEAPGLQLLIPQKQKTNKKRAPTTHLKRKIILDSIKRQKCELNPCCLNII